jgi:hypothetical protein
MGCGGKVLMGDGAVAPLFTAECKLAVVTGLD